MKKITPFNPALGVYCCPHVFANTSAIQLVIHDDDWQFLCGEPHEDEQCHLVGIGHLLERDASLQQLAALGNGCGAMRIHAKADWELFTITD